MKDYEQIYQTALQAEFNRYLYFRKMPWIDALIEAKVFAKTGAYALIRLANGTVIEVHRYSERGNPDYSAGSGEVEIVLVG